METLSFSFFTALYHELEMYENILSQLKRDYEREEQEQFIIAIDFSELYNYIHATSKDAQRALVNKYILNNLNDQFTVLPGSFYELLNDIENITNSINKPGLSILIKNHKTVFDFFSEFPKAIQSYDAAIDLYRNRYRNAEKEVETAISFIINKLVPYYGSIQALHDLINRKKLVPITGIEQISNLTPTTREKYKNVYQLIESYLNVSRYDRPQNNQIDAIDSIITMLLNQEVEERNRYITIYSQTKQLIRALRSHDELKWDNDYLVRDAQYLKFRTNLQNMFTTIEQRLEYVNKWLENLKALKLEISKLVDIDKQLQEKSSFKPSIKLIDQYRKFDEECRQPLLKMEGSEQLITKDEITELYQKLKEQGIFAGKVENSFDILKEYFRNTLKDLNAFKSLLPDSTDINTFIGNIKKWLEI